VTVARTCKTVYELEHCLIVPVVSVCEHLVVMNESDLQYYIANKEQISEAKSNAISKRSAAYAGLRNHGATCYLNSLIQCLFHDQSFVRLILEVSDNSGSVIIKELKTLFARMVASTNQALDTEPLLVAFGWSKSQLFEQHDIHELFSVLLDALCQESAFLKAGIAKLFQGQLTGLCLVCVAWGLPIINLMQRRCSPYRCSQVLFVRTRKQERVHLPQLFSRYPRRHRSRSKQRLTATVRPVAQAPTARDTGCGQHVAVQRLPEQGPCDEGAAVQSAAAGRHDPSEAFPL
jgi:hypothetical protein